MRPGLLPPFPIHHRVAETILSHQVSCFLAPEDLTSLEDMWRGRERLCVLHARSSGPWPRPVPSCDLEENGKRWLFFYLVREVDLKGVVMAHAPVQGDWTIDVLRSPVIELTRCFFDREILRRGRLYFTDGFFEESKWIEKHDAFNAWAKALLGATKRRLTYRDGFHVGEAASRWQASGGRFVG